MVGQDSNTPPEAREPSRDLYGAYEASLDAALDIEGLLQRRFAGVRAGIRSLNAALDPQLLNEENVPFFAEVLRALGHSAEVKDDVIRSMRDIVRNLRAIEIFGIGDLAAAKRFCLTLNSTMEHWVVEWRKPNRSSGMFRDELQRVVHEWLYSPEGQSALDEAEANVKAAVEKVERDTRVDPEDLRKPMTI